MAKRGRKQCDFGRYVETGRKQSAFGVHLHKLYKDRTGKKLSQMLLAQTMGIPAPTLTLMLQFDEELVRSERLYLLFKNLARLLAQFQVTIFEDQARELLGKIEKGYNEEQKKDLLRRLIQELIVKRESTTLQGFPLRGRDEDIQKIITQLVDKAKKTRFLTLVGVPGVGKSELARQIRMQERIREEFLIPDHISFDGVRRAVEVKERIANTLEGIDRQKNVLLNLNDCEEIADNAEAVDYLFSLRDNYPNLTILATSRVLLSPDKHDVEPLDMPGKTTETIENLQNNDAVRLFCESAQSIDRTFRLTPENAPFVAALCIGLGGLPLAMIIAGSLIGQLTPKELYERLLDKRPKKNIQELTPPFPPPQLRHISLNALIAVSYGLLDEKKEQILFRRLGEFRGQCSIEAIAKVCSLDNDLPSDPNDTNLTNMLTKLTSHRLIIFKDGWVHIAHVTLRDYAERQLGKEETEKIIEQFFDYYWRLTIRYISSDYAKRLLRTHYVSEKEREDFERYHKPVFGEHDVTAYRGVLQKEELNIEHASECMIEKNETYIETETARRVGKEADDIWRRAIGGWRRGDNYYEQMEMWGMPIDHELVSDLNVAWEVREEQWKQRNNARYLDCPSYFIWDCLAKIERVRYGQIQSSCSECYKQLSKNNLKYCTNCGAALPVVSGI